MGLVRILSDTNGCGQSNTVTSKPWILISQLQDEWERQQLNLYFVATKISSYTRRGNELHTLHSWSSRSNLATTISLKILFLLPVQVFWAVYYRKYCVTIARSGHRFGGQLNTEGFRHHHRSQAMYGRCTWHNHPVRSPWTIMSLDRPLHPCVLTLIISALWWQTNLIQRPFKQFTDLDVVTFSCNLSMRL